ncbi:FIST signal transduction protein [Klenkia soli]|nr:FIST N-terminal domain-containing protein [Klenkia soli]
MDVFTGRWVRGAGWSAALPGWDSARTLVLVFGPSALVDEPDHAGLADLRRTYPVASLAGCSTAGEVLGAELSDDTLAVAVVRFATTRVVVETTPVEGRGSDDVGRLLGKRLAESGADLALALVLSDGLAVNGSALGRGVSETVPAGALVAGGLAGDGPRFARTWVLVDGVPRAGAVAAVGLFGADLEVGHASRGGWSPLGPERLVTRSAGTVLHELDGRPVLDLYREYLGDLADGLPATGLLFPLGVRLLDGSGREVVRTILGVDHDTRSITYAGEIPQGATAQLMRSTTDRLVDGAEDAGQQVRRDADAGDSLALLVSCVGRRQYLGQRTEEELEVVVEALGPRTPAVGFYSYGELTTLPSGACHLENQTMTVTVFGERPRSAA